MAALSERDELDVSQMSAAFPAINPRPAMESDEHNERYKELYWKAISKVIADILNPNNNTKICFEEVYSLVYKCVCDGFSESLRMDLLDKCITHLHEVNQQLDSCVILYEGPRKVVETVCALNRALDAYLPSIQQIYSVCGYMNKLYSEETPEASLHSTLLICFCQIVCDHRLDAIMKFIESCPPFTFLPSDLLSFFSNLHMVSLGHYATMYPKLFSRYIANVLPEMSEHDLESHIEELARLQADWRATMESRSSQTGVKRPAED
ncbi:CDK2-associated and cullin domain-containing protein 1-like isoform X2 [Lycorma delicatula]